MRPVIAAALLLSLCLPVARGAGTDDPRGLDGLAEVEFNRLSDQTATPLGKIALAIHPAQWKHAETANFVYHFFHGFVATPVAVEAEFYYRVIAGDLERDTAQWERKSHLYIFEKPEDWKAFQKSAALDPWTGGIHSGGDLFLLRDPEYKFKGRGLGHEITHLVLYRFFGNGVPLWLNEGCAEYASTRGYASYMRRRGFLAKPASQAIAPARFIPLNRLAGLAAYPQDEAELETFYNEAEKLVRFLNAENKRQFLAFLDALSKGGKFETALWRAFGGRFVSLDALEREFKSYATRDYAGGQN